MQNVVDIHGVVQYRKQNEQQQNSSVVIVCCVLRTNYTLSAT